MMTDKKEYREGDAEAGDEKYEDKTPVTAFMVVLLQNGSADVILQLPGFDCSRKATMQDVRDMANAVAQDAQVRLIANATAGEFTRAMAGAAMQMRSMREPDDGE
jgi:hypothetical protein